VKIVHADKIEASMASRHRAGGALRQRLLDGPAMSVEGYSLVISRPKDRYSPRHRHNFEQFRYQIEGEADYSETGILKPGMIGYFPEGVHYGPQKQGQGQDLCVLTLQFGGASGGGYAGRSAVLQATDELMKLGTFKDGVFHRNPGLPGKKNVDGFQAIWEHLNGRPLTYPNPRYEKPILMHPENFEWVPVDGEPGAYEKVMGIFTERRAQAGFVKIDAGAAYTGGVGRDIFVVVSGTGHVVEDSYRRFSAVQLDPSEKAVFRATEPTELLHLRLPNLAGLGERSSGAPERQAAE
jgi:mannose-6-phosphate isomerase-like protein (cupin superfamily)